MNEFELIRHYFQRPLPPDSGVVLGIGDDAAVLDIPAGNELVLSMDTLVSGVHFPADAAPDDVGWKALAVNLSDLAAMGAQPRWVTLSLTLPQADERWLAGFSAGFFELAGLHDVALIGGDLTRGPLAVSLQAHGCVPAGCALIRAGARPGDRVAVTGPLGDAGFALGHAVPERDRDYFHQRLHRPRPLTAAAPGLRGRVTAAIDLSDGLIADLTHICAASDVAARLQLEQVPLSAQLQAACDTETALELALTAGDDYELCITLPADEERPVREHLRHHGRDLFVIGIMEAGQGVHLEPDRPAFRQGYRHF